MDCSKTEVFLAEWQRMCKTVRGCERCMLYRLSEPRIACVNNLGIFKKCSAAAIKIVQDWSDQHPVKTRLSVLKEQYPNARMAPNGAPYACVKNMYGGVIECPSIKNKGYISDEDCLQCWNTPIEDGE